MNADYDIKSGCLRVIGCCANGHRLDWVSSDFQLNKKGKRFYDINLLLVAAVVVSGNNFAKINKHFKVMGVSFISPTTFYNYQQHFVCPTVNKFYISEQVKNFVEFLCVHNVCILRKLLARFCSTDLILSGDSR